MSTLQTTNITHGSNTGTENLVLASSGAVTTADDLTVGDNLVATKQNGCQRIVLEQFWSPVDGSTIALSAGNLTLTNVTAAQDLTSTFADITGSSISYTPPTGTTQVIYEYQFYQAGGDTANIGHYLFNVDGTDVANSKFTQITDNSGFTDNTLTQFKWGVNIGGTAATATTGRLASWSGAKILKMRAREYGSSYDARLNEVHHWDGASGDHFTQPCIGITAIG